MTSQQDSLRDPFVAVAPWFAALDGYAILASANFGYAQDDTLIFYEAKNRGLKQLVFAVQTAIIGSAARRRGVR